MAVKAAAEASTSAVAAVEDEAADEVVSRKREAERRAADEALTQVCESAELEVISRALEVHRSSASEEAVAHAKAVRDRLKERRRKESQKQRRAHALQMQAIQTHQAE